MNSKFKPIKFETPKSKFSGAKSLQTYLVGFGWIYFVLSIILFFLSFKSCATQPSSYSGLLLLIASWFLCFAFLLLLSVNTIIKLLINLTENSDRKKELLDSINNKNKASDKEG